MRSFKVQAQLATYTVRVTNRKDKHFDPAKNDGLCEPNLKRIYIAARLSDDCRFTTYVHELMHAIFFELDRAELAYNEPLVETMSQIIAKAIRGLPAEFKA